MALPVQRAIERAELRAYLQAVRHATTEAMGAQEPLAVYAGHLAIVFGLRRGRAWCCCGKRAC